jgi:energy-coupling factor transporter ATP-binding protein EcfA2
MYRKHFAFTQFSFDLPLQPEALFASSTLIEAEARLNHLLELRAIGLVTGEAGSGKTTICRKLAAALHPGLYRVFYVPPSTGNVMDMYKYRTCGSIRAETYGYEHVENTMHWKTTNGTPCFLGLGPNFWARSPVLSSCVNEHVSTVASSCRYSARASFVR